MRLKLSFQIKLFLCTVAFSCLLLTCIGAYTYYQLTRSCTAIRRPRPCRRGKSPSFLLWWRQWKNTTPPELPR